MTREDAAAILEEVKTNDDSMFAYNEPYMIAIDMAIDALKARETSLEKVASDYGLTVDGVRFALDQYQRVICEITHSRMSKLSYYADDILRLANDIQCDYCEKEEWIEVEDRLPPERETIFAKLYGTDKWKSAMFRKMSDDVRVVCVFDDGSRRVWHDHTVDGKWDSERLQKVPHRRITHWMENPQLPEE